MINVWIKKLGFFGSLYCLSTSFLYGTIIGDTSFSKPLPPNAEIRIAVPYSCYSDPRRELFMEKWIDYQTQRNARNPRHAKEVLDTLAYESIGSLRNYAFQCPTLGPDPKDAEDMILSLEQFAKESDFQECVTIFSYYSNDRCGPRFSAIVDYKEKNCSCKTKKDL